MCIFRGLTNQLKCILFLTKHSANGIFQVFQTLHCLHPYLLAVSWFPLVESCETSEMLLMKVLSHTGDFNSKCCIVANWTCLTCNVVLFLSLKVPLVTKSLASPSSTTWCQTPSRTRHSSNLSTAFKPCVNVCVFFYTLMN